MKILFITTSLSHRTFRKTVRMMGHTGVEVVLVGFDRSNYPPSQETFTVIRLGDLSHGNFLNRALLFVRHIPDIRTLIRKHDVVHCFGLDALLMAELSGLVMSKVFVYQVQDVHRLLTQRSVVGILARFLESSLVRKVDHVVVSSIAYIEEHLIQYPGITNSQFHVIENKLEHDPLSPPHVVRDLRNGAEESRTTIGYFGVLRCQRSWNILTQAVEADGENPIELYVRGIPVGLNRFFNDIHSSRHICYEGPYRDPDDLPGIYTKVDLVWAAYPYGFGLPGNWQWARTVRFYEAGAFGLPMVVQAGTQDAEFVSDHSIGLVVDMSNAAESVAQLLEITDHQIQTWKANIRALPREYFIHSSEYSSLKDAIIDREKKRR